ncbi:hypothetical protein GIB67_026612 [Kingdonia uniflora]|uniref:Fringe-like glycosyltransferase domain-containing protein n=1 Tax=Kingdonia uniflora TaxID=39325 RepID=A0A7J7P997_9MAGN|nr:hypothetical protein GIB67_026612 [Kingdonia uniflora]
MVTSSSPTMAILNLFISPKLSLSLKPSKPQQQQQFFSCSLQGKRDNNHSSLLEVSLSRTSFIALLSASLFIIDPALAFKGGGPYGVGVTRGQDLTGKDFSGKTLIKQDFKTSILRQANFKGAKLLGASFFDADLTECRFQYLLRISGADMSDADLRSADFSLANVTKVNLSNANLEGALTTGNTSFKGSIITGAEYLPWSPSSPPFRVSENTSRFKDYDRHKLPFVIRIVRVLLEAFREERKDVRWYVVVDDDTVLFVDNLVEVLARYDHNKYLYIGESSEGFTSNYDYSFHMAFGGAGFLSRDPCEMPHSFFFDSIEQANGSRIVTSYVRKSPRNLPTCSFSGNHSADAVMKIRVFSPPEKLKWVGRRECCDVVRISGVNVTEVRIRLHGGGNSA